jgi:hypothetical protein
MNPICAGAQNPQHAVQHRPGIAPAPAAPIPPLPLLLIPLNKGTDVFPLHITHISHASDLLQLPAKSKR